MQNQLAAQAIKSGAFGGGREGVAQAELGGRLDASWVAQQRGFGQAPKMLHNFNNNNKLKLDNN